jgi:hypothetical protein
MMPQLKPGEIWQIRRDVKTPIEVSPELYSETARNFLEEIKELEKLEELQELEGMAKKSSPRYVMIVNQLINQESTNQKLGTLDLGQEWQEISVMVLSREINFASDVDILIPGDISGLGEDLVAETWHVVSMLSCNLLQRRGSRLSREIYNSLLDIGDAFHSQGKKTNLEISFIYNRDFHQREKSWADVLTIPTAAYHTYTKGLKFTESLLFQALEVENHKIATPATSLTPIQPLIHLSKWLKNINGNIDRNIKQLVNDEWIKLSDFLDSQQPAWAMATRSRSEDNKFTTMQLESDRRVKLINLGITTVALEVEFVVTSENQTNNQANITLRLYPTGEETLLPPNLKLVLLDNSHTTLREITVGGEDIYLQLKFSGSFNEKFSVRVVLGEVSMREDFII